MKKWFLACAFFTSSAYIYAQNTPWKIAGNKIKSPWADSVNPNKVLPEYPRPQMQRSQWQNLNGLWQYAILPKAEGEAMPASLQGDILVPFCVESGLSGVGKTVGKDSILWYSKTINVAAVKGKKTLLHFGAVDWRSTIYINDKEVAMHEGGFDPFTIDITSALQKGNAQKIAVKVWDPTDDGPQPRGKQVKDPEGIWYTPVTGIWQTVWIENVPETYITSTRQTPDLDKKTITVNTSVNNMQAGDEIHVSVWKSNQMVAEKTGADTSVTFNIDNVEAWSPSNPSLYDLKVAVKRKGKTVDEIKSYFAMRKASVDADKNGIKKMMLNNAFLFEFGPLDQGWWPDGLYTAPTDAALKFDIEKTKEMGFNMIRKHIKIEPARWYYYCDSIGILVWQDMPSGDLGNKWENRVGVLGRATDKDRTAESEGYYKKEWNIIMDALYNFPSIISWQPFNEAWGQFKTEEITKWTMQKDPTRIVNSASGGNFYPVGDVIDLHSYPDPAMPAPEIFGAKQALVCGEFGGLGLPLDGHTWQQKNWGYQSFGNSDSLYMRYTTLTDKLAELIQHGLSAAVYTQTTDVEGEVNGFMTYDRKVMKMPIDKLRATNEKLYKIVQ